MVELTQSLNDTLVKSQNSPDQSFREGQINTIKWKNESVKYVRQVKTLENAIFQKQRKLDTLNKTKYPKNAGYGKLHTL